MVDLVGASVSAVSPPVRRPRLKANAKLYGATCAVLCWAAMLPLAFFLPKFFDLNPFTVRGAAAPAVAGLIAAAVLSGAALIFRGRRRGIDLVICCGAGVYSAWIAMVLWTSLHGTPFGFAGLVGDMQRMSAMATRYATTSASTDHFVTSLPSEYPPLYHWIIGRSAAVTGIPAWRLLGDAEVITVSLAVLAAFLLWRMLVPSGAALAIAAFGIVAYGEPLKPFAVLAAAVFTPWVIASFVTRSPWRMHWAWSGLIGGGLILLYQGYFMYAGIGLLLIVGVNLWSAASRRRYLSHCAGVLAVALIVSSWFLVPYASVLLAEGGQATAMAWVNTAIADGQFPFLQLTLIGLLQLTGLFGAVWYRLTAFWAAPVIMLVVGAYAYYAVMGIGFLQDGGGRQMHYVVRIASPVLAAAGVLTVAAVARTVARAGGPAFGRPGSGMCALLVVALAAGTAYADRWSPNMRRDWQNRWTYLGGAPNEAVVAHQEPLPSGQYPPYGPEEGRTSRFPVLDISRTVRGWGQERPLTLSYDERLFSYLPWPGYVGVDRTSANSLVRWDDRHAEVRLLAQTRDARAFAARAAATRFGPIDLFVLRRSGSRWTWLDVAFDPGQFDTRFFLVRQDLPHGTVIALRKPELAVKAVP
ncbi:arabinofuranosyltransferase [Nonomuraea africana]|uniref:Arabinofuranosyltransferase AftA N-terminal domain-containing protein n=1 Tax=Nonomuraea africana TaxID=46171 RepID=A0ABR9KTW3_9ACTN|nr:arabinofuranosyltransferase [Nonomuraea africana]MBE1565479.1 hypothetical protein [Nonomuraea africana]